MITTAYRIVFCVLTICETVVFTNSIPINFLKILGNEEKITKIPLLQSILTASSLPNGIMTVQTATVGTDHATTITTSRAVRVRAATTNVPSGGASTSDNSARSMDKMYSALRIYAATMTRNRRREIDDYEQTTATVTSRRDRSATRVAYVKRRITQRKVFKKKFPSPSSVKDSVEYDFSAATLKPEAPYRDPIVAQEFSGIVGSDFFITYPTEKKNNDADAEDEYYKNSADQSARVWKPCVAGNLDNLVTMSMGNNSSDDVNDVTEE